MGECVLSVSTVYLLRMSTLSHQMHAGGAFIQFVSLLSWLLGQSLLGAGVKSIEYWANDPALMGVLATK